jgi:hypothetical protein
MFLTNYIRSLEERLTLNDCEVASSAMGGTNDLTTGIWFLRFPDEPKAEPFLSSSAFEGGAAFSPDNHWIAFVSNESGRDQIYLKSLDSRGIKKQVSMEGGRERSGRATVANFSTAITRS